MHRTHLINIEQRDQSDTWLSCGGRFFFLLVRSQWSSLRRWWSAVVTCCLADTSTPAATRWGSQPCTIASQRMDSIPQVCRCSFHLTTGPRGRVWEPTEVTGQGCGAKDILLKGISEGGNLSTPPGGATVIHLAARWNIEWKLKKNTWFLLRFYYITAFLNETMSE